MTSEEMQTYFPTVYPKMFVGKYGGVAVGTGWFNILNALCRNIQSHLDWKKRNRDREIEKFNAKEQGIEALRTWYCGDREPSGWFEEQIEETMKNSIVIPDEIPQVTIAQIKEKFGTLRFYYDGGDDVIGGMVSMAESMSAFTCEECGDAGEGRNGGWVRTLCDKHEAEYQQRIKDRNNE